VVTLDLFGEVCPYTFVKTKLMLEQLEPGAELRVLIDHAPARTQVPRACEQEGHVVAAVEELGAGQWAIRVRKAR
jgi:tRNA 2-thiouridine synthesizing protein A